MDERIQLPIRELLEAEFDRKFYLERYGDVSGWVEPLDHFLAIGWIQGRDPSQHFSVFTYLLQNDDVLFRHVNPFVHYLVAGRDQGRASFDHVEDDRVYLPWDAAVTDLL